MWSIHPEYSYFWMDRNFLDLGLATKLLFFGRKIVFNLGGIKINDQTDMKIRNKTLKGQILYKYNNEEIAKLDILTSAVWPYPVSFLWVFFNNPCLWSYDYFNISHKDFMESNLQPFFHTTVAYTSKTWWFTYQAVGEGEVIAIGSSGDWDWGSPRVQGKQRQGMIQL